MIFEIEQCQNALRRDLFGLRFPIFKTIQRLPPWFVLNNFIPDLRVHGLRCKILSYFKPIILVPKFHKITIHFHKN